MENRIKKSKLENEKGDQKEEEVMDVPKKNIIMMKSGEGQKNGFISQEENDYFKKIDEIIEVLCKNFKDFPKSRILEALRFNTFDLEKTFNFLSNPEEHSGKNC
jgi:hypothetical protein